MKQQSYSIDVVIGLLLFCVFTASMLFVLISGAGAYQNISNAMEEQYSGRTCLSYLAAKVKHYDTMDNVTLTSFGGVEALALDEQSGGETYRTLIYYYDGHVYELFASRDSGLVPGDGFEIIAVDSLRFEQAQGGLIRIICSAAGREEDVFISVQSGKGVAA